MNNMYDEDDRSIGLSEPSSYSTSNSNVPFAKSEGRGEKSTFNNIEIIRTPKRKKVASAISKLVCRFSGDASNRPVFDDSESPAKRRKVWGHMWLLFLKVWKLSG